MSGWRDYYELCKPRVVALMLITALAGMFVATPGMVPLHILFFGLLGIGLASGSAAAINHLIDQRIDALMGRTKNRPLPTGRLTTKKALLFSLILGVLSMVILCVFINVLTAVLTFLALMGYALFYTAYLKRATPQNIVIGGTTGAIPPLLGWTAVTGSLDPHAWLLVLIIFTWTPPHFWALAIHRRDEYARAGIPMLPVTHGIPFTKLCITLYSFLLLAVSLLPVAAGLSGLLYFAAAIILGLIFIGYALLLQFGHKANTAMKTFQYSIWYLLLLFIALLLDHYFTFSLVTV